MTLYEVTNDLIEELNSFITYTKKLKEEGEEDKAKTQLFLASEFDRKIHSYAKVWKNLEAENKEIEAEMDRLKARKNEIKARMDSIQDSIKSSMAVLGRDTVKGTLFTIQIFPIADTLVIEDETKIPKEFITQKPAPPPSVDKKRLNIWAKTHDVSDFGHFEPNFRLTIK